MDSKFKTHSKPKSKYKEDLIASNKDSFIFKDSKKLMDFKERLNLSLKKHFDEKTYDKEQKSSSKHTTHSRFDKVHKSKKKVMALFAELVLKLGFDTSAREVNKKIIKGVAILCSVLSILVFVLILANDKSLDTFVMFLVFIWVLIFVASYLLTALVVFLYMDIRMHQYVRQIEDVLPDYLQLASANISAGMTVDRALWYAIRPKFGILATEMENVAKATIAGEELEGALVKLGRKYDSRMLKETINLIVEGIQSGGEMANLLNKLSTNIKDTQLMRKEIGASVTTYAIFIGVATVLAAPLLFALSTQLLEIMQKIFSTINVDSGTGYSSMFSFNFSGESIDIKNFRIFSIVVLVISSFFSASIISVIRKGSVKDGLKTIPIFMIISIILYYAASAMFGALLGGMF